jgi:hypothetical protein
MGKVKNLIWDEIEYDQEEPITPLEEKEAVQVVPTWSEVQEAFEDWSPRLRAARVARECAHERADFDRKVAA